MTRKPTTYKNHCSYGPQDQQEYAEIERQKLEHLAEWICKLPSLAKRRAILAHFEEKLGLGTGKRLRELMRDLWASQRKSRK